MANNLINVPFVNPPWYCAAPRSTLSSVLHTDSQPLDTRDAATKADGPMLPARMCATKSRSESTSRITACVRILLFAPMQFYTGPQSVYSGRESSLVTRASASV
eukprot:5035373-Prymnesium_polylepis.2